MSTEITSAAGSTVQEVAINDQPTTSAGWTVETTVAETMTTEETTLNDQPTTSAGRTVETTAVETTTTEETTLNDQPTTSVEITGADTIDATPPEKRPGSSTGGRARRWFVTAKGPSARRAAALLLIGYYVSSPESRM